MTTEKDAFCDGAVELSTTFKGAGVSKRAECQKPKHHRGSCTSEVALLTLMGQQVRIAIEWDGPSVTTPTASGSANAAGSPPGPPPRPTL